MKTKRIMADFEECLIESLQNPEEAAGYLRVALEEYSKDHDIDSLCDSLSYIAAAKEGLLQFSVSEIDTSKLDQLITKTGNLEWAQVLDALDIAFLSASTSAQPSF